MRKGLHFAPPERESACDRSPPPRRPELKQGESLRLLKRRRGEDARGATERARTMPWWGEVVETAPYWTATIWMFRARGNVEGR